MPLGYVPMQSKASAATHCFWAWSMRLLRLVICEQHGRLTVASLDGAMRARATHLPAPQASPAAPVASVPTRAALPYCACGWRTPAVPWPWGSDLLSLVH